LILTYVSIVVQRGKSIPKSVKDISKNEGGGLSVFDFEKIKNSSDLKSRYEKQIDRISGGGKWQTDNIESTVANCIENIKSECRSFVIYGEPQSGKTEMMISLSAKLIDEGFRIILILMNDSVDLLNQNLDRFKRSGIDPTPVNFTEILDKVNKIEGTTRKPKLMSLLRR
jgi:primosomal protein N'